MKVQIGTDKRKKLTASEDKRERNRKIRKKRVKEVFPVNENRIRLIFGAERERDLTRSAN